MWAKLLLRQPANALFKRTAFRFSMSGKGKGPQDGAIWDKGKEGGEYREHAKSEKRDVVGSAEKMSFQQEKLKAAPQYDQWNDNLDSLSKKMYEDKGSARWSREASEKKIDVETDNNTVAAGGDGPTPDKPTIHQQAERMDQDRDGFRIGSAGRIDELYQKNVDTHAAGRFDQHYEGTSDNQTSDMGGARRNKPDSSKMPGSGIGKKTYASRVDSQWSQMGTDKESWKSDEQAKIEKKGTDQQATLNRWADHNPAAEKFKTSDKLSPKQSKQKK